MERNRVYQRAGVILMLLMASPFLAYSQSFAGELQGYHMVLDRLYSEMIPLSSQLIDVGRGIAGFAALTYIGSRVWRHIANAEPVEFYPLLRPFALGMAIMLFPSVLALMNGILQPVATATNNMVTGSNEAIAMLLEEKKRAIESGSYWDMYIGESGHGDRELWTKYADPDGHGDEGWLDSITNGFKFVMEKASFQFQLNVKRWMSEILQILFQAAGLAINTIRIFYLIVLSILGPLVFGLSVFEGFQQTLNTWIARYVNVYMWLPVANIFGAIIAKIQENMLRIDIEQVGNEGKTFFSPADTAYLIFLVIAIIGYMTVPSVSNYIIQAGGRDTLLHKTSNMVSTTTGMATKYIR